MRQHYQDERELTNPADSRERQDPPVTVDPVVPTPVPAPVYAPTKSKSKSKFFLAAFVAIVAVAWFLASR